MPMSYYACHTLNILIPMNYVYICLENLPTQSNVYMHLIFRPYCHTFNYTTPFKQQPYLYGIYMVVLTSAIPRKPLETTTSVLTLQPKNTLTTSKCTVRPPKTLQPKAACLDIFTPVEHVHPYSPYTYSF